VEAEARRILAGFDDLPEDLKYAFRELAGTMLEWVIPDTMSSMTMSGDGFGEFGMMSGSPPLVSKPRLLSPRPSSYANLR
jgi:hypothetical protein